MDRKIFSLLIHSSDAFNSHACTKQSAEPGVLCEQQESNYLDHHLLPHRCISRLLDWKWRSQGADHTLS